MKSISPVRRAAVALAAIVAAAAAGLSGVVAVGPATAAGAAAVAPASRAVPKTTVTFEVPGCNGCEVGLAQARWDETKEGGVRYWHTASKEVDAGTVSFTVPTKHTQGMSMTVIPPWEGNTGYVTTIAFRYGGERVGDPVGFREARGKTKGSACWAGTTDDAVTIPLTIRPVWVEGVRHRVRGSIAYANVTQDWMVPMRDVGDGVMGSQDVNVCGERPQTAAAKPSTTDLTVALRGCDRCSIQLQHAIDGAGDTVWTSRSERAGADHQVVFRMPTRLTHGLSFVLRAPWQGGTGAVPNMVTRYAGHAVGSPVGRADARHGRRAEGCWAGTTAHAARLTFRVDRVRTRTVDGHPTQSPLAYSSRTLPSWKPVVRTYKGTIGNQDAFYCTQP